MNFDKITQPKIVSTISLLCLIFIIRYHLVGSFDINLNDADVAVCLEPPLNLEKLDKCINSSTNNIKKWSYLPDTGECAFLSAAQECAIESGNDFKNEHECRETCFYAKCYTSPVVVECTEDEKETDFWFYNPLNGTCVKYRDGECPGNANGFEHEMDCYAACSKALCAMGADRSDCQGRTSAGTFQRWFMNITSGRCEQFLFANCPNSASDSGYRGGNLNNYLTEKDCVDMCSCKDGELPGMKCHPLLLNLKASTDGDKTNSTSSSSSSSETMLKSEQQQSFTKLPQNLFTGVNQPTSESSTIVGINNKMNEITVDPHLGHNHVDEHGHEEHEHHHKQNNEAVSVKFSLILIFFVVILYI